MTELVFYGGVNEIGGNKILVRDRDVALFFDFGYSFTYGNQFFVNWLRPRRVYGVRDYFEFNLLPPIKGLYHDEYLAHTSLPYTAPKFQGVVLSHAHFDHVGHLKFLDPRIPIYCGSCTRLFMESQEESTPSTFGFHEYRTFRTGDTFTLDAVHIEPIHVDHSIPGAYGFLIHTSQGTIVYTGDLRAHGPKYDMTQAFIDRAAACDPIALITEGTRMLNEDPRTNYSEAEVKQRCQTIISATEQMVFVTHYGRDMDRFRTIYEVTQAAGRQLVISTQLAYLLFTLRRDEQLDLPNPLTDDNILVYYRRKHTGTYAETDYYHWERGFMDKLVTGQYVHNHQRDLVMDLGFYQFGELIDIKPRPGSHFIHSMSEPFSEEDIEDQVMRNWLQHFGITFHQLHASGHLNRQELTNMITQICPNRVFPIHTEQPHLFQTLPYPVTIVQKGCTYRL
jgi:ribonuclease J